MPALSLVPTLLRGPFGAPPVAGLRAVASRRPVLGAALAARRRAAADAAQAVAGVWQADALHGGPARVAATGHAQLDADLPGGGWPLGAMTELLQPVLAAQPDDVGAGEAPLWPLLLPALVAQRQAWAAQHAAPSGHAVVVLVGVPRPPYLPALAAAGLPPDSLLWLPGAVPAAALWSAEQALRCADVAAVLAWLPRVRQAELRRLHLAAAQRGDSLLFVLRPAHVAREASPAPLRLQLELGPAPLHGLPEQGAALAPLVVRIVKRRGPPLAGPLLLPSQPSALRALMAASAARRAGALEQAAGLESVLRHADDPRLAAMGAQVLPFMTRPAGEKEELRDDPDSDALDRLAVAA
ncbi:translesion DNA synthesis-associated protein ImuA [Ottowia sp.]|uniref:translesion DNA synthesis-associated protein ImuA n=1 Tax=Ottowia sp. TaxID=1898956 RepID=UPI002612E480|nr:translesion DNA synthesis-associated protein ImuA [Ottowia sp.]